MKKSIIIVSLIYLILTAGQVFGKAESDKNKLEKELKTAPEIEHAKILNNLAKAYWCTEKQDHVKKLGEKALALAIKYKQKDQECFSNINIGYSYFKKKIFNKTLKYLNEALEKNKKVEISVKSWNHAAICNIKGAVFLKTGRSDEAILLFKEALKTAERNLYRDIIAESCKYSAEFHIKNNNIKMALRYLKKGFKHAETDRNNDLYKDISKTLSELYLQIGNKKRSEQYLELYKRGVE